MKSFAVLLAGIVLVLGMGCEGPEGPTGPQGQQGPQGEQGAEGSQGPPGTANVIYSEWIALSELEAATDTTFLSRNYRKYEIPASELTQEFIEMGAILVYFRLNDSVMQLPATFGGSNPIYITFSPFQPGILSVLSQNLDNSATGLNTNFEFRYILIPGGTPAKAVLPDLNDYYAVMDYFGIEP